MLRIEPDAVTHPQMLVLLERHLATMHALTPVESVHALDLDGLRAPDVTMWGVWEGETLLGCGALKTLSATHGELKSFHTASEARGRGVAALLLRHVMDEAAALGLTRLSLETGRPDSFAAAQRLYARHGFVECGPFGDYEDDPLSLFMTREIGAGG